MTYTYVNGNTICNWMVWRSGLSAGQYEVFVFIPRNYATTRSAKYKVEYYVGNNYTVLKEVAVNQYIYSDVWVSLGTYNFPGEPAVFLGDNTGEAYSSSTKLKVGFDQIKFVGAGAPPMDTTKPVVNSFRVSPGSVSPGGSFTMNYTVSDSGGSGMKQVELWRANDNGGRPGSWCKVQTQPISGNGPSAGSFTNALSAVGVYWYGMHIVDNAGNWSPEPSPCKVSVTSTPAPTVPCFYQKDSSWASKKLLPSSYTMGNSGCLVTAMAAVACWGGYTTNPGTLCDWLSSHNGFSSKGYLVSSGSINTFTGSKVVYTGSDNGVWKSKAADLNKIKSELDAGRPVILEVHWKQSDSEDYMHWVVAVSYTASGSQITDIAIMDPNTAGNNLISIKKYVYTSSIARWIYAGNFYNHC